LAVTAGHVDLAHARQALGRVGLVGAAAFLVNIALTIGGPFVGWHLLMRSLGIPVSLRTTLVSGLLGRAINLFSPFNYFGGESVRTFHVAAATGAPRRKVLAAVVVSEVQVMAGLTVFVLVGLGIWAAAPSLAGSRLPWAAAGAGILAIALVTVLGLALGDVKPCLRVLDALIRWGVFPRRLTALREATLDLEILIRSLFLEHRAAFLASQLVSLSSPVAQFLRPTLFFWLLGRADPSVRLPGFMELTVFFVLSQIVFMLPTSPGGVGVYEAGVVGLFGLLGWNPAEGAAYGILLRLDDVVFLAATMGVVGTGGLDRVVPPSRSDSVAAVPATLNQEELQGSAASPGGREP
jgi:uncharacterized membrane protein YbhN (UPF0104 family)